MQSAEVMSEGAQAATDWKHEYRVLVGEMEATERGWRASESLLRRAASQIAIAAMGQNELLDQCLEAVLESLRAELTPDVLEAALDGLSGSLRQLPRSIGASAADAEIALIMRELISRFSQASVFREASRPLAMTMERALADNDWVELARGLADTVAHVTSAIDTQKAELEAFLEEVTRQLEQFEGWTDWNMQANAARQADSSALGSSVDREMSGISFAVDAGSDIVELKREVQARLAAVAEEFARFRDAEAARNAEAEARASALTLELDNLK